MAGTSLSAPHPTIANLYPVITDQFSTPPNLILLAYCTGAPDTTASVYQHGAIIIQTDSGTGVNAVYQNTGSVAVPVWTLLDTALGGGATKLVDTNGVTALDVGTTASAVNNLRSTDAAANRAPILSTVGASSNPGLQITAKGSGVISIGSATSTGVTTLTDINYVAGSGSSANAAVGTLVDANGINLPLTTGMKIAYKLDSTFQNGANTLNLNGFGTKNVKKNANPSSNLQTNIAAGAILEMIYDGTQWQVVGF